MSALLVGGGRVAGLCGIITQGDIPTKVARHREQDLWAKIIYNAIVIRLALASLRALFDSETDIGRKRVFFEKVAKNNTELGG